jgi:hypothetical protein
MSEDRWTYPAEGDTSGDIDREMTDPESVAAKQEQRIVVNPQEPSSHQGHSADAMGTNPSDRRHEEGGGGQHRTTNRSAQDAPEPGSGGRDAQEARRAPTKD